MHRYLFSLVHAACQETGCTAAPYWLFLHCLDYSSVPPSAVNVMVVYLSLSAILESMTSDGS